MKLRELEKLLKEMPLDRLDQLIAALRVCLDVLPEVLVQELALRTLWQLATLIKEERTVGNG